MEKITIVIENTKAAELAIIVFRKAIEEMGGNVIVEKTSYFNPPV